MPFTYIGNGWMVRRGTIYAAKINQSIPRVNWLDSVTASDVLLPQSSQISTDSVSRQILDNPSAIAEEIRKLLRCLRERLARNFRQ